MKPRRRYRRAHPGCPKSIPQGPNDIWPADYKGQFRLKNGSYCFPLTVSDLSTRFVLGVDAHPAISLEKTFGHFSQLFETYGLPNRIRTDNGVPFASYGLPKMYGTEVLIGRMPHHAQPDSYFPCWRQRFLGEKQRKRIEPQSLEPSANKRSWGFLEHLCVRFIPVSVQKMLSFLSSGAPGAFCFLRLGSFIPIISLAPPDNVSCRRLAPGLPPSGRGRLHCFCLGNRSNAIRCNNVGGSFSNTIILKGIWTFEREAGVQVCLALKVSSQSLLQNAEKPISSLY